MHKLQRDCFGNPFCLVGSGAGDEILSALADLGFTPVVLPPDSSLPDKLCSHCDLNVFYTGDSLIFRKNYYNESRIADLLEKSGVELPVILTDSCAGKLYPGDVGFCAKAVKDTLICNPSYTDPAVLSERSKQGKSLLPVKQGYAACSTAITGDGCIITSDRGIYSEWLKKGLEGLLITPGHILLEGYGSGCDGFIGGCSGLCGDTLYFTGDITAHPDGGRIIEFCNRHGTEVVCLSKGVLRDIGGIIFV